ncbi:MAG: DUF1080 domain-containing protein [Cyclobacteriaceae bacterium]
MKRFLTFGLGCLSLLTAYTQELTKAWQPLLTKDLNLWEVWMGVPHISVDLEGVEKSADVHVGTPLGLNNDPKKVFSIIEEDGELLLAITGEIYGGLTTLDTYENYHFKTYFKWGDKKWAPRANAIRDNGILYHCRGDHGAFWNVWKSSLEYQVQEDDMGDFISIANSYADCLAEETTNASGKQAYQFNPDGKWYTFHWPTNGYGLCSKPGSNEKPNGEWNLLEIIAIGDRSVHLVNGQLVNVVRDAKTIIEGEPVALSSGQIQIQSEGAECYYKGMEIRSMKRFPKEYKSYFKK